MLTKSEIDRAFGNLNDQYPYHKSSLNSKLANDLIYGATILNSQHHNELIATLGRPITHELLFGFLTEDTIFNLIFHPKSRTVIKNVELGEFFIFPGSFNPLHKGHRALSNPELYSEKFGNINIAYEMSVINTDKPPIGEGTIMDRLELFTEEDHPVLITKTPFFSQKLNHFSNFSKIKGKIEPDQRESIARGFILGFDTLERLFQKKYYSESNSFDSFIGKIVDNKISLQVAGRLNPTTGLFEGLIPDKNDPCNSEGASLVMLEHLQVPIEVANLVYPIVDKSGNEIRVDISSTEIRNQN